MDDLRRSHAELRAALILAGRELAVRAEANQVHSVPQREIRDA